MTIPARIYFDAYAPSGVTQGVKLDHNGPYYHQTVPDVESPFDENGNPLQFSCVPNTPFEATIQFLDVNKRGKGLNVRTVEAPVFYNILPEDLLPVILQGEMVNGHVRGQWIVQKRRKGFGLSLVRALPWGDAEKVEEEVEKETIEGNEDAFPTDEEIRDRAMHELVNTLGFSSPNNAAYSVIMDDLVEVFELGFHHGIEWTPEDTED